MPTGRMVRVATLHDRIEAQILAARLGSEGVLWELRGGGLAGPYPMGPVHVYVAEDDLEVATDLLTLGAQDDPAASEPSRRSPAALWFLLLAIVAVTLFGIARVAFGSGMSPSPPPTVPAGSTP
jgi:hypothetical protein